MVLMHMDSKCRCDVKTGLRQNQGFSSKFWFLHHCVSLNPTLRLVIRPRKIFPAWLWIKGNWDKRLIFTRWSFGNKAQTCLTHSLQSRKSRQVPCTCVGKVMEATFPITYSHGTMCVSLYTHMIFVLPLCHFSISDCLLHLTRSFFGGQDLSVFANHGDPSTQLSCWRTAGTFQFIQQVLNTRLSSEV